MTNHLAESCPARSINPDKFLLGDGSVGEQNLSQECMRCIQHALHGGAIRSSAIDTYDRALEELRQDQGRDVDPEEAERWSYISMSEPGIGLSRRAFVEMGFDIGGESYVSGQSRIETMDFNCLEEQ